MTDNPLTRKECELIVERFPSESWEGRLAHAVMAAMEALECSVHWSAGCECRNCVLLRHWHEGEK